METWEQICRVLAPNPTCAAHEELAKAAGVAASSISSEGPKDHPIIVHGGGPQVRIYCIYGEDAVNGDGVEEEPLSRNPTEGDWRLSLPVPKEDLEWSQRKLKATSTRVTARAVGEELKEQNTAAVRGEAAIDMQEFLK